MCHNNSDTNTRAYRNGWCCHRTLEHIQSHCIVCAVECVQRPLGHLNVRVLRRHILTKISRLRGNAWIRFRATDSLSVECCIRLNSKRE